MGHEQQWLPLLEYAVRYKLSVSTLRRYIKGGKVQSKLIHGKYFILDDQEGYARNSIDSSIYFGNQNFNESYPSQQNGNSLQQSGAFFDESSLSEHLRSQPVAVSESERTFGNESKDQEALSGTFTRELSELREEVASLREELSEMRMFVQILEERWADSAERTENNAFGSILFRCFCCCRDAPELWVRGLCS
jgi:hypothetical protein